MAVLVEDGEVATALTRRGHDRDGGWRAWRVGRSDGTVATNGMSVENLNPQILDGCLRVNGKGRDVVEFLDEGVRLDLGIAVEDC